MCLRWWKCAPSPDRVASLRLLAFETSGAALSAAAAEGERLVAYRHEDGVRGHAERLLPVLQQVLATAGWGWRSIELVAVTLGPGNFTGLRAGIAVARGLSLALGCPALGLGTLEVMAQAEAERQPDAGPMQALLDARRGEVYAQPFAEDLTPLDVPRLLTEAKAASLPYRRAAMPPDARSLALLAAHRLAGGAEATAGSTLRPLYLRAPDARPGAGASLLSVMG